MIFCNAREMGALTERVRGVESGQDKILSVLEHNRTEARHEHETLKAHVTEQIGLVASRVQQLELEHARHEGAEEERESRGESKHKRALVWVAIITIPTLIVAAIIGSIVLADREHALQHPIGLTL